MNENFLSQKLQMRATADALRSLRLDSGYADFFSNDYLGIARNGLIENLLNGSHFSHGSTGSRLLSGNYPLIEQTEKEIAFFHDSDTALIFNSGYDANFGLMESAAISARAIKGPESIEVTEAGAA